MPEPKVEDILRTMKAGGTRDLILKGLVLPNGAKVNEVVIDNDEDARLFKEQFGSFAGASAPYRAFPAYAVLASERAKQYCDFLSNTHDKYQAATKRVLQMLIDICGDLPADDYEAHVIDHFEARIKFLPKNPDKVKNHRERWAGLNFAQIANDVELSGGVETISEETIKLIYPRTDAFDEALPVFDFPKSSGLRLWVLPFCLVERVLILPPCGSLDALFGSHGPQLEGQGAIPDRSAAAYEVALT